MDMEQRKTVASILKIGLLIEFCLMVWWFIASGYALFTVESWRVLTYLTLVCMGPTVFLACVSWVVHFPLRRYGIKMDSVAVSLGWFAISLMFLFVIPTYAKVFRELGASVPLISRWVLIPGWILAIPSLAISGASLIQDRWKMPSWTKTVVSILPILVFIMIVRGLMIPVPFGSMISR